MSSALIGYGHIYLYYMWTLRIKYHIQHFWVLWEIYDSTKYGPFKVNYSIFFNCEINFYGFPTWGLEQLIVTLISLSGRDLHSYDTTIKYFTKCFEVVNSTNGIIHFQIHNPSWNICTDAYYFPQFIVWCSKWWGFFSTDVAFCEPKQMCFILRF